MAGFRCFWGPVNQDPRGSEGGVKGCVSASAHQSLSAAFATKGVRIARASVLTERSHAIHGSMLYNARMEGGASQLRKGIVEYCVLALLTRQARYGGELVAILREKDGLLTSEGTIYPLLSRMRAEGLVDTEWQESAAGPPRRYYSLTTLGSQALSAFRDDWVRFRATVDDVLLSGGDGKR